jgi:formylmethanofuran dehydrogenase subunit E
MEVLMKRKLSITALCYLSIMALYPAGAIPEEYRHRHGNVGTTVIVDTDMGLDDVRAIFALLNAPGVEVGAVITTEGSASAAKAADNVIGLIESAGTHLIHVYRGRSLDGAGPPKWRARAETLGGYPFPPPRELSHIPLGNDAEIPGGRYLALGPFSSLAYLEKSNPGRLAGMSVWIPVSIDGVTVKGWNLGVDPGAARLVMEKAGNLFLVDTSHHPDAAAILHGVEGNTPAARWIAATSGAESGGHTFLYDEIAAAALAAPQLFRIGRERFKLTHDGEGIFSLRESGKGNARIVRLDDQDGLEHYLHMCWEASGHDGDGHKGHIQADSSPLARMRDFHGHLGPYVVLGYRMGRLALQTGGSHGHFDVSAEVHSILKPPRSCLIDGVQLGSGCTLGKRNITIEEYDGSPYAIFRTSSGTVVTVRVRPEIPRAIEESVDSIGVEETGKKFWEMEIERLFDLTVEKRRDME